MKPRVFSAICWIACPGSHCGRAIDNRLRHRACVTDASGAVIPGATVSALHEQRDEHPIHRNHGSERQLHRPVTATRRLPAGSIRGGFKRSVREGIVFQVQQSARVDMQMTVGDVVESVVVTADATRLETENATLSKTVDNRAIVNLPLNTRNVYSLVFLTPGVTGSVGNSYGEMRYSVNGARARTMDTMIDGVSAAHPTVNGFNGISVFPSVDAIEEFKLLGADYPGRVRPQPGQRAERCFKSGTNRLHGSAYEFLRNSTFDAKTGSTTAADRPC